jgi:hypothetical protein
MFIAMQSITSELLERLNRNMYGDIPNIPFKPSRNLIPNIPFSEYEEEHVSIVLANWFILLITLFTSFLIGS